jgi:hypothetical protein
LAFTADAFLQLDNATAHKEATMELLTAELRAQLPPLYAQEDVAMDDKTIYVKLFTPDANWTWYVTEGSPDGDDFLLFGFVYGHDGEWGYSSLNELEALRGPLGLPLERDLSFQPTPWGQVKVEHEATHAT